MFTTMRAAQRFFEIQDAQIRVRVRVVFNETLSCAYFTTKKRRVSDATKLVHQKLAKTHQK
jgi:hypothetical protein